MRRFFDRDWYRYLWHYRVSRGDKIGFAAIGCLAVMLSGLGTAAYVSQEEAAAVPPCAGSSPSFTRCPVAPRPRL